MIGLYALFPEPLFSFDAFVSSRLLTGSGFSFLAGLIEGLSLFLPEILLVFFIFPLWKSTRAIPQMKYYLSGVSITAASLITVTAINQSIEQFVNIYVYIIVIVSTILLLSKKIPASLIVILAAIVGFIF